MARLFELRPTMLLLIALFVALVHAQGRSKWGSFQGPWSMRWNLNTGQPIEATTWVRYDVHFKPHNRVAPRHGPIMIFRITAQTVPDP